MNLYSVVIIMLCILVFYFWWKSKTKCKILHDISRRPFNNQEKFEVAQKVIKEYGELRCTKCGETDGLEIDHLIPISKPNGTNALSNLTLRCLKCNRRKGNRYEG